MLSDTEIFESSEALGLTLRLLSEVTSAPEIGIFLFSAHETINMTNKRK